jgi:hypothetical protein
MLQGHLLVKRPLLMWGGMRQEECIEIGKRNNMIKRRKRTKEKRKKERNVLFYQ